MKSIMDEDKISNIIDKFQMYKNEEELSFEDLKKQLYLFAQHYDSGNNKDLESTIFELCNKIETIKKIHSDDLTILKKNLEKYKITKAKVEKTFDNINIVREK